MKYCSQIEKTKKQISRKILKWKNIDFFGCMQNSLIKSHHFLFEIFFSTLYFSLYWYFEDLSGMLNKISKTHSYCQYFQFQIYFMLNIAKFEFKYTKISFHLGTNSGNINTIHICVSYSYNYLLLDLTSNHWQFSRYFWGSTLVLRKHKYTMTVQWFLNIQIKRQWAIRKYMRYW